MSARTLILVKPDGVRRGLVGEVISRIERKGLTIAELLLRTLDEATAKENYAEHTDKPFFGELVSFITSGPLVAMAVGAKLFAGGGAGIMGMTGGYVADVANAQEVNVQISGALGDSETGGASINIIPRTGGTRLAGTYFMSFTQGPHGPDGNPPGGPAVPGSGFSAHYGTFP